VPRRVEEMEGFEKFPASPGFCLHAAGLRDKACKTMKEIVKRLLKNKRRGRN